MELLKSRDEFNVISDILGKLVGVDPYSLSIIRQLDEIYEEVISITEFFIKPEDKVLIQDKVKVIKDFAMKMMLDFTHNKSVEDFVAMLNGGNIYIDEEFVEFIVEILSLEFLVGYLGELYVGKPLGLDTDGLMDFYIGEFVFTLLDEFNITGYEDEMVDYLENLSSIVKDACKNIPDKFLVIFSNITETLKRELILINNNDGPLLDYYTLFKVVELENKNFVLVCLGVLLKSHEPKLKGKEKQNE